MFKVSNLCLILSVFIMSFLVGYYVLAVWTEPSAVPPGINVNTPINSGDDPQQKTGYLNVGPSNPAISAGISAVTFYDNNSKDYYIDPSAAISAILSGSVGIGTTDPGTYKLYVNGDVKLGDAVGTDLLVGGGAGKIDVGTIDPVFDIDGEKYATYMADFAGGTRVETSGNLKLIENSYVIDFDNLEKGSNLWLFWQSSNKNLDALSVLLTPNFEGKTWYAKNENILIIYGSQEGEISYRLSIPRFDYKNWSNIYQGPAEGMKIK